MDSMTDYSVTGMRNPQTKHWRGLLRGYEVTSSAGMCVQGRAGAHTWAQVWADAVGVNA